LKENYTLLAFAPKSPEGDFLKLVDLLIVTISHFRGLDLLIVTISHFRGLWLFFQKEGVFFQTLIISFSTIQINITLFILIFYNIIVILL